jgi:hypothetical protein
MSDAELNRLKRSWDHLSPADRQRCTDEIVRRSLALWARERGLPAPPPSAGTTRKSVKPPAPTSTPMDTAPLTNDEARRLIARRHSLSPVEAKRLGHWITTNFTPGSPAAIARQVLVKIRDRLPARIGLLAAIAGAKVKAEHQRRRPVQNVGAAALLNNSARRPPVACQPSPPLRRRTH